MKNFGIDGRKQYTPQPHAPRLMIRGGVLICLCPLMITLKDDALSFALPEFSEQLRLLVDRHVQSVLSSYVLPANRDELVDEIGSMRPFWTLSKTQQKNVLTKAHSLTREKIEAFLQKVASVAAGLNNASPPRLTVKFQQRPGPPNDAKLYVFSAGLEDVPLYPATDFPVKLPASWVEETDFLALMNASEPFSIRFAANYPFALKVAVGNLDRVTGEPPFAGLQKEPRNYLVVSGESTVKGINERSFVLALDVGCTVDEQFLADQKIGRIDLQICPLRVESYFSEEVAHSIPPTLREFFAWFVYGPSSHTKWEEMKRLDEQQRSECVTDESGAIVLGRKFEDELDWQYIKELGDLREVADWDPTTGECCSIHVCNSSVWQQITGNNPPQARLSAEWYESSRNDGYRKS
jgi:hypothetical protein